MTTNKPAGGPNMQKKLLLKDLAKYLAADSKLTEQASEEFIRLFFSTIQDGLNKDGQVKIKGWGTFKVIETSDRTSVDVSTGNRITIDGYKKLTFVPEASLKDIINKPFSSFETVPLNEGYDETADEVVMQQGAADSTDDEPSDDETFVPQNQEETATIAEETNVTTPDEIEVPSISEEANETAPDEINQEQTKSEEPSVLTTPDDVTSSLTDDISVNTTAPAVTEVGSETIDAEPAAEATEVEPAAQATDAGPAAEALEAEAAAETTAAEPATESQADVAVEDGEADFVNYIPRKRHTFKWYLWLPLLLCLILGVALYFVLHSDSLAHESIFSHKEKEVIEQPLPTITPVEYNEPSVLPDTTAEEAVQEIAKEPETTPESTTVADQQKAAVVEDVPTAPYKLKLTDADMQKPLKDFSVADTTSYAIAGTVTTHTLKSGETLTSVALHYYGDKRLWPYIVKYNDLKNHNSLAIGQKLKIPYLKNKE